MSFLLRELWDCQFLEEDLKTSLPRRVSFSDPVEMRAFARRGGCVLNLEGQQAFDHALAIGRGGVWLSVTAAQYARLSQRS